MIFMTNIKPKLIHITHGRCNTVPLVCGTCHSWLKGVVNVRDNIPEHSKHYLCRVLDKFVPGSFGCRKWCCLKCHGGLKE